MWIPAVEKGRARAVQNMVAAAEATASLEPIAVDVMVDMVRLEPVVVARSVDPEAPLMVPNVVARNEDPVVPLAEDAAVEVVRPFSIIYPRRLRPPFSMAWGDGSAIAVYVSLTEV